ncbi:hypothetical protein GBAR_LOCUS28383 [Geodia barretti]|uniref:Sushi domain-containing protein n=1 Tax=Geodia barretti TaxID=519541 RepID=A0AA35XAT9_GEOBA|nr:hypothetical protein GBAR_LOCUS28383 [Geodia barretti]
MQNSTLNSGCLLVYGAAFFDSSHEEIRVNNNGTIRFNLSLAFTKSGNSGLIEEISSFVLANMVPVAQCDAKFNIPCTFSGIDSTAQWWTVEREEEYNVIFVLHQARSTNRGLYSAEVEGVDPATQSLRTIEKNIFVSVVACNKSSPKINGVNATYLESTETEIVGSQVNYSCNSGCTLQGSKSFRCRVEVIGGHGSSEWVNDTGGTALPSCSCYGTALVMSQSPTTLAVYKTKSSLEVMSGNLAETPTDEVVPRGKMGRHSAGLNAGTIAGVSVVVGVFIPATISLSLLAFIKFRRGMETKDKHAELGKDKKDVSMIQNIKSYTSRHSNTSESSSIDCNHRDSFIETIGNESFAEHPKNSRATNI